jgi:prepilin-type N-terminal cleavage/methylation domain-containing protein
MNLPQRRSSACAHSRRGFNMVELLIALAITALLLTATAIALNASYIAYQRTTREASTHTISRLTMDRIHTLIRTGNHFGPLPANPNDSIVTGNLIEIITVDDAGVKHGLIVEWDPDAEALFIRLFNPNSGVIGNSFLLLEGVIANIDPGTGQTVPPFTLEYELGYRLHRATIDLSVIPDDNQSVQIEGTEARVIRLVATAMPRRAAYTAP